MHCFRSDTRSGCSESNGTTLSHTWRGGEQEHLLLGVNHSPSLMHLAYSIYKGKKPGTLSVHWLAPDDKQLFNFLFVTG